MSAIWSIMAITVERAWVLYSITRAKQYRTTMARMRMVVSGLWMSALCVGIPPLLGWNRYVYEVGFVSAFARVIDQGLKATEFSNLKCASRLPTVNG